MSEITDNTTDEDLTRSIEIIEGHAQRHIESVERMPFIRHTNMVRLEDYVTTDKIPLTGDDLDTAIKIVNDGQDNFFPPIVRGRDIELNSHTILTTSAGAIQEFYVKSALRYLSRRPASPNE